MNPLSAAPSNVTTCAFSSASNVRLLPLSGPVSKAVVAQGVPLNLSWPLIVLLLWVSVTVPVTTASEKSTLRSPSKCRSSGGAGTASAASREKQYQDE